jgi:hypothetical protein
MPLSPPAPTPKIVIALAVSEPASPFPIAPLSAQAVAMKAAWSELAVLRIRILALLLRGRREAAAAEEEKTELGLGLVFDRDMVVLPAWDAVIDATEGVGIDAAAEDPGEDANDTADAEELWDDVNVNVDMLPPPMPL